MPSIATPSDSDLLLLSPYLLKLSRRKLAPIRLSQLLVAARSRQEPREPEPWECCASSCKPCVRELWREEKRVWEECHPDGEDWQEEGQEDPASDKGGPEVEIRIERQFEKLTLVRDKGEQEKGSGGNEERTKEEE